MRIIAELTSDDDERTLLALAELPEWIRENGGDPDLVPSLVDLTQHGEVDIRRMATWALGRLGLAKVGDASAIPALNASLSDEDPETRENSAWALGEMAGPGIGDSTSIEPLNFRLKDPEPSIRGMAAWALGRLASRMGIVSASSKVLLTKLLDDESEHVRKAAALSIHEIDAHTE
jgi:HEAT repeat protein